MKPLIGSNEPGEKAALESIKKASVEMAENYRTEYLKFCVKYAKRAKALYNACKYWFSKPADQIVLEFHRREGSRHAKAFFTMPDNPSLPVGWRSWRLPLRKSSWKRAWSSALSSRRMTWWVSSVTQPSFSSWRWA